MTQTSRNSQSDSAAPKRQASRRKRVVSLGLLLAACAAILFVALRLAAPHLISNSLVRSAIASSIADWAGHEVTIEDVSMLRFWPEPEVTLSGVRVSRNVDGVQETLIEVPEFSAGFSLLSALRGTPDFNGFRLNRPRIRIERKPDGRLDWSNEGLLSEAVRVALSQAPASSTSSEALNADIGSVAIVDGEITLVDQTSGTAVVASDLDASMDWRTLSAPLSGEATFNLNGRPVELSLQTPTPLLLIGGAESEIELAGTVPGFSGTLKGLASLGDGVSSGAVDLRVADMALATASLGLRVAGTERWQTASLKAQLTNADQELRFEDLVLTINDIQGDGILTLSRQAQSKPLLSGTLALDHLELGDLLQGLSIEVGDRANVRLPSVTRWVDIDMRLSAATAAFSGFPIADLGASLVGRGDSLKLVIGDTRFLGGTLSARLTGTGEGFHKGAEFAVAMDRVDLGALMSGLAINGPTLKGTGSVRLAASLVGTGWQRNIEAMSGTLEITADSGEIVGFDANGLRQLATDRAYFQLSAAGQKSFEYETLDTAVRFSDGTAEVTKGQITGERETLTLTGIVPYSRQALALSGKLAPNSGESATPPLRFFIGGAWSDPVISPIPPVPTPGQ